MHRKTGKYGRGKVIDRRPILEEEVTHKPIESEAVQRVTDSLKKMSSSIAEFGEVMAGIGTNNSAAEIIKNTFVNFSHTVNPTPSPNLSPPVPPESLLKDDDVFNEPSFLEAVTELEAAFYATVRNISPEIHTPSFQLLTPTPSPPHSMDQQPATTSAPAPAPAPAETTATPAAAAPATTAPTTTATAATATATAATATTSPRRRSQRGKSAQPTMEQTPPPTTQTEQQRESPASPRSPEIATMLETLVENISRVPTEQQVAPPTSTPKTPAELEFERYTYAYNLLILVLIFCVSC